MKMAPNESACAAPVTTSAPIELPGPQEKLFREVLSMLGDARVPYVVAGAFALQQHAGIHRFTKDLDIFLTPADASAALRLLDEKGLNCEICDPIWLAKAHRDGYFIDLITGMSNGALTVDDSWIKRAYPALILGTNTRVLAPEELIASKLFVLRRERFDGSDIAHVVYALQGRVDWQRILELAGEHWELLLWNLVLFRYAYPAHSHFVPQEIWEDLLSRFTAAIRSRNPQSRFRGTLIDDKMFAIDVNEWGLENILEEYQRRAVKIDPTPAPRTAAPRRS
jgi:hypothetical protein